MDYNQHQTANFSWCNNVSWTIMGFNSFEWRQHSWHIHLITNEPHLRDDYAMGFSIAFHHFQRRRRNLRRNRWFLDLSSCLNTIFYGYRTRYNRKINRLLLWRIPILVNTGWYSNNILFTTHARTIFTCVCDLRSCKERQCTIPSISSTKCPLSR